MNLTCDPFADTVLDYAYNLAASGALTLSDVNRCWWTRGNSCPGDWWKIIRTGSVRRNGSH